MALTVQEASVAYQQAMRNVGDGGEHATCRVCHTFIDPEYEICFPCRQQPESLSLVLPVSYSEHGGQLHLALRNYKDGSVQQVREYAWVRLTAILWRFLAAHESCLAGALRIDGFDLVTTVPSSSPEREAKSPLRQMVEACRPIAPRHERLLGPSGTVLEGRDYDIDRYLAQRTLGGESILLVDDTWTRGGHAQSAAGALLQAGAGQVALVVIGRHLTPDWEPVRDAGVSCDDIFSALPRFDWDYCAVHDF
ncbi:MAG: hypothetical protein JJE35_12950 [Thermoleophilia bacterium]|nr:hypothetical protein [Thermoleophilia bacterium]